jgi:TrmH family RNA methyltransferase
MEGKRITSMHNPLIKNISLLKKKKSARKDQRLFIVEGLRAVKEIPNSQMVKYYITTESYQKEYEYFIDKDKWIIVTQEIFDAITDTISPQGIMAVTETPFLDINDLKIDEKQIYLLLENIQDPGNLGTIIRSAHAFGIKNIILTKGCVDLYSPKVVRSTMGSLFHVNIIIDASIEEALNLLKRHHIPIYATALEDALSLSDVCFKKGLALLIGNEGNGLSDKAKQLSDYKIKIDMPGGAESLNASIAASICIYEVMKQTSAKS